MKTPYGVALAALSLWASLPAASAVRASAADSGSLKAKYNITKMTHGNSCIAVGPQFTWQFELLKGTLRTLSLHCPDSEFHMVADPPGYAQGDSDLLLKSRNLWHPFFYDIAQYDMAVEKLQVKTVPVAARRAIPLLYPTGVDLHSLAEQRHGGQQRRRESSSSSSTESADSLDGALMSTEGSAPSQGPFKARLLENQQCRMFEAGFHWLYHITDNSVNDEHALKIAMADDDHSVANSDLKDPFAFREEFLQLGHSRMMIAGQRLKMFMTVGLQRLKLYPLSLHHVPLIIAVGVHEERWAAIPVLLYEGIHAILDGVSKLVTLIKKRR
ncbi:hypothetical protein FOZ60_014004 [Perkinsus olseni]|uniref:Uncharacterized protein n=1 Tax=Perkinsus olseni TaxID=32597 RepID=A0A7J6N8J4_PEROL|nr:hypothetical protein FOZ60_014004 [Perkinsus olseni]